MSLLPKVDLAQGALTLGGRRLVFHCNHYNVFLQRTLEDGLGADARSLLIAAGCEAGRRMLEGMEAQSPSPSPEALLSRAAESFALQGFGKLEISELTAMGGKAKLFSSHYALGWTSRWGNRKTPGCFFPAGYLSAMVIVAGRLAPERVTVREEACLSLGREQEATHCLFSVEVW